MMRTRGLIGPAVQKGKGKGKAVATTKQRAGVKPVGNYIVYKINNP